MSNERKTLAQDGFTVLKKGHTVAPGQVQNGYTGPTGTLGIPPTSGSAVAKPSPEKKG